MLDGAVPWPAELAERYERAGYWAAGTLADVARDPARGPAGGRTAVVCGDERVSYAELDRRADVLAAGLADLGVRRTDRVVVQLPNRVEFVVVCLALFRLGAIPVLALAAHRQAELTHLCAHTDAVALVVPDLHAGFDHRELARQVRAEVPGLAHVLVSGDAAGFTPLAEVSGPPRELAPPDPAEVALCLLSGGTTGTPKLIPRTHRDYAYQARRTAREMRLGPDGAYLAALPAAHNAALGCPGVLGTLAVGGKVVLAPNPAPDVVFPLIAREGVTLTTLMPAFLPLWMDTVDLFGVDLSRLVIEVGGARLDPAVARQVEPVLGCTLTRWFGMAEGLLAFSRIEDPPDVRVGTEGHPLSELDELRVVDADGRDVPGGAVGELLTRGPCTLRGYYRAEDYNSRVFTADGFLRTGDLVRLTPRGDLEVEGRLRDVVNRGGEKVPTGEVEEHLRAHPAVKDASLVAVPDRALGEKSCAFVVPLDPRRPPVLTELRAFLSGRGLADYKLPDRLVLTDAFPYTPVGKVHKAALRDGLRDGGRARPARSRA